MPCQSDYTEPNLLEIECSKLYLFLGELKGVKLEKEKRDQYLDGFHPNAYCMDRTRLVKKINSMTAQLCTKMKSANVAACSLELQMWWRDHQALDLQREKRESAAEKAKQKKVQEISEIKSMLNKIEGAHILTKKEVKELRSMITNKTDSLK